MLVPWSRGVVLTFTAALLGAAGCAGETRGEVEDVGARREAETTANALTANALTANALTANALTANALTATALTATALTANALTASALADDADARTVLKYIVGCALPEGTQFDLEFDGQTYTFAGSIGLAPEWGKPHGRCDAACRGWVSGCVLARLNYLGETVPISIRGEHVALASTPKERYAYPHREATYYGNIFTNPQIRLGCLSPGATSDERVCGPSLTDCVITFTGSCERACDGVRSDESFPNCHSHGRNKANHYPPGTTAFRGSVSVFLQ
jgi:hypothetical protein